MQKKVVYIFIVLFAALSIVGCGADRQAARVWQTRDTVEAYVVDGFTVLGKTTAPNVTLTGTGEYPTPERPVSGSRAATVKAECAALYATLEADIAAGSVLKHAAADDLFDFDVTSDRHIVRIDLASDIKGAHPIGLFLPAGEIVTVAVPPSAVDDGLVVSVNEGFDDLEGDTLTRMPKLQYSFALDKPTVRIASPFGGLLSVVSDGSAASLTFSGVARLPLYRLGVDDTFAADGGWTQLLLGNLNVTAPARYVRSDTLETVCRYWRSAVETMGLTRLDDPLHIVFDDGAPDRARLRLPTADADVFFDPERLYAGEGKDIFEGLAHRQSFGYIGREAGVQALLYRAMTRLTSAPATRSAQTASDFDAYTAFARADFSADSFALMSDRTRAAFLIGLDDAFSADVRTLVGLESADALVSKAAEMCAADLGHYAALFKIDLQPQTIEALRAYGQPFYPLTNLYAGSPYLVSDEGMRLDFATYTADPSGVYSLTKASGKGLKKVSDGVYDFMPQEGFTQATLTYKNATTREKTKLTVTLIRASDYRFEPQPTEVAAIGRQSPLEINGVTVNAPYIVPVTHSALSYGGDFEARTDGAYYGGVAAFGKVGAQVDFPFYGDTVLLYAYPSQGTARVTLDNGTAVTIDLSAIDTPAVVYYAKGRQRKHTLHIVCETGEIGIGYFAVSFDPNVEPPTPLWLRLTILIGGALAIVTAVLLLLFLLVFPLCNKYRGTDFPCRNFKTSSQKTQDRTEKARKKRDKLQAQIETESDGTYDDSWVPTVILPPVTAQPPESAQEPLSIMGTDEAAIKPSRAKTTAPKKTTAAQKATSTVKSTKGKSGASKGGRP